MIESFYLGYPVEFQHLCLVYPPKVKDVATNTEYPLYLKLLTLSQEDIEDEFAENHLDMNALLTPFEYLINLAYNNPKLEEIMHHAFQFFIHEDVLILYEQKMLVIGNITDAKSIDDLRLLKEDNYFDFQNLIRQAIGSKPIEPYNFNEHPSIKAMKAKARLRDRVKMKEGKGLNFKSLLASICCMGFGLNPLNIGELSYAALPFLLAYYQEKEKYEMDISSLLAGADSKKVKPKYWIRNLDEK